MKTLNDFDFNNKKAIIRVDFNVPLDENFKVTDATRIEAAKPTIDAILAQGGSVILMSHLGRPKGVEEKYSLKHILSKTSEILGVPVQFASNCIGEEATTAAANLKSGEVLLLENVRFHAEEEKGEHEIYAIDSDGNPYSPSWYTLNLKSMYKLNENFTLTAGLENITDQRYRPYSSGIVAPGKNFVLALRAKF